MVLYNPITYMVINQPSPESVGLLGNRQSAHSVGWAFDGLPNLWTYGYTDRLDNTSAIKRLESGYSLKTQQEQQ